MAGENFQKFLFFSFLLFGLALVVFGIYSYCADYDRCKWLDVVQDIGSPLDQIK